MNDFVKIVDAAQIGTALMIIAVALMLIASKKTGKMGKKSSKK